MSTEGTKESIADTGARGMAEEIPQRKVSHRMNEGIGVFRALLLTALFYLSVGWLLWFAWRALRHSPGH